MKNNNKQSQGEEDALQIFNDVKDSYAQKIEELNELKKDVFRTDAIDQ
jgi:NAD(P)H-dependent flavin oxidoreductase YrpB (nitropropane dioxygenase family)